MRRFPQNRRRWRRHRVQTGSWSRPLSSSYKSCCTYWYSGSRSRWQPQEPHFRLRARWFRCAWYPAPVMSLSRRSLSYRDKFPRLNRARSASRDTPYKGEDRQGQRTGCSRSSRRPRKKALRFLCYKRQNGFSLRWCSLSRCPRREARRRPHRISFLCPYDYPGLQS